jgi:2-polyprenyl-3-methyl-5-hydroxy-6-metoxy-1,4-benzoquinol methylase
MINRLQGLLHRPERGWDPIPESHARSYAEGVRDQPDNKILADRLEEWIGGFQGKTVLDLGAGPGQCSVELARRGAKVVWHDVSRRYMDIARQRAVELGVELSFSLGYLEDSRRLVTTPFDLVFCRGCWAYCLDDRDFSALIYDLVKPGGHAYVSSNTDRHGRAPGVRRLLTALYETTGLKIGHPHPPHGKLARLFSRFPLTQLVVDYSPAVNDVLLFRKEGGPPTEHLFALL